MARPVYPPLLCTYLRNARHSRSSTRTSGSPPTMSARALEVFGQSGLGKDDLARIWTLANIDDCGKFNIAEFPVAMGLIYRKLNGNEIPEQLPPELVPTSSRDLSASVDLVHNILKNDTRA
ncbi:hypothetical protein B0H11DRAFT_2079653 [Mycena galericulata]|nr:hypothetical protein B0H11DRAFT_2125253 [Mycena galericulata]KAJ7449137.1 hypothetical protein B0H11DRAFT_2079653 [Mycena galericulata]